MKLAVLRPLASHYARSGARAPKYYPSSSNAMRGKEKTKCILLYKTAAGDFLTLPEAPSPRDVVTIVVSGVPDLPLPA
jgi:hypothetical protein